MEAVSFGGVLVTAQRLTGETSAACQERAWFRVRAAPSETPEEEDRTEGLARAWSAMRELGCTYAPELTAAVAAAATWMES
jgi:hypothetical protein